MTWIKLDDRAVDHPKVASLTDRAFRWWVRGLSYASTFLTDGILPPIFWKQTPKQVRSELSNGRLWDWNDPNFHIHDYLAHQSSREAVDRKKAQTAERVKRYREKHSNAVTTQDGNGVTNAVVTPPEIRDQIQRSDTEIRVRTTTGVAERGVRQIINGAEYERLRQFNAYVGQRLRVPNKLHEELLGKSGNRDLELRQWYASLDEELEATDKGTGDVFEWLRPRHQAFAIQRGWVDVAPKASGLKTRSVDEIKRSMGLV